MKYQNLQMLLAFRLESRMVYIFKLFKEIKKAWGEIYHPTLKFLGILSKLDPKIYHRACQQSESVYDLNYISIHVYNLNYIFMTKHFIKNFYCNCLNYLKEIISLQSKYCQNECGVNSCLEPFSLYLLFELWEL